MFFLFLILTIGVLTTFTDLKSKKIYNQHLSIGAVVGIIAMAYAAFFGHKNILSHITSGLVAFLIGTLLHRSALWKGGDAKLFTLYAFLMPPTAAFNDIPFPSAINLFACSFIAGMAILLPAFIKDILINHSVIINDLFLPARRQALFLAIGTVIFNSWILFSFYYLARTTNPVIILTINYFSFIWGYDVKKEAKKHFISDFLKKNSISLLLGISFGLLMRLWFSPNSLSYPALTRYIFMTTLSVILSTCIHTTFNHFRNYHERVPFAPLLFMGCMLSYTPFLATLMHIVTQWNVLLSR